MSDGLKPGAKCDQVSHTTGPWRKFGCRFLLKSTHSYRLCPRHKERESDEDERKKSISSIGKCATNDATWNIARGKNHWTAKAVTAGGCCLPFFLSSSTNATVHERLALLDASRLQMHWLTICDHWMPYWVCVCMCVCDATGSFSSFFHWPLSRHAKQWPMMRSKDPRENTQRDIYTRCKCNLHLAPISGRFRTIVISTWTELIIWWHRG